MLQTLMDLGYPTAEETNSLPLALDTEIHDMRSNPMQPLPNLSVSNSRVTLQRALSRELEVES